MRNGNLIKATFTYKIFNQIQGRQAWSTTFKGAAPALGEIALDHFPSSTESVALADLLEQVYGVKFETYRPGKCIWFWTETLVKDVTFTKSPKTGLHTAHFQWL